MAPVAVSPAQTQNKGIIDVEEQIKNDPKTTLSKHSRSAFPKPPVFIDKYEEREYLKFRLSQSFRIFVKLVYDEGVAGHITIRVCMRMSLRAYNR